MPKLLNKIFEYDLELALLSSLLLLLVAHQYNIAETFIRWAEQLEHLQVDELISVALYLMLVLPILIWRRWRCEKSLRLQLAQAIKQTRQLEAFLHMCANCHAIKDEDGTWCEPSDYIHRHTKTKFSHSVCPECMYKLYPEYADQVFPGENAVNSRQPGA